VPEEEVIAVVPKSNAIFESSLQGKPVNGNYPEIDALCAFLETYRKPVTFKMA
jgi:CO dehydrogenase nickel-insertion accessory protein CooC1